MNENLNDDKSSLNKLSRRPLLQRLFGFFNKQNSKEDLLDYLQEAQENNVIDNSEASMLAGVLSVSEQRVRDVMLPKSKMVTVNCEMPFDEVVEQVLTSGHSRFPVEKDDNIVGILLAKDLLGHIKEPEKSFNVEAIMRPVRNIPESKPLDILLREFRYQRLHMVIVTNEYGDVAGLVTIEDVLEEIVGEIDDEHDNSTEDIEKINSNQFIVSALTEVENFNQYFQTELDDDTHDTIGGFVLSQFGYIPTVGEQISFAGLQFTVKQADDRRILSLLVRK